MAITTQPPSGTAVNWNKPSAAEVVQKAVESGITDPAGIAKYAKDRFGLDLSPAAITKLLPKKP